MMYIYPLEEIKPDYNFLMGYHTGIPKEWYCGIEGITYIFMGCWSDAFVGYNGYAIDAEYITDNFLSYYREEHPEDKNDDGYDVWLRDNMADEVKYYLDELIGIYEKEQQTA